MINFSIISTGSLKKVHGANYVLDFLIRSSSRFENVKLTKVFSGYETIDVSNGEQMPIGVGLTSVSHTTNRKIRAFFRDFLDSKYFVWAYLKEYLNMVRPAQAVIRKVLESNDMSDWYIFQDIHAAYWYFKLSKRRTAKTAIIIHQADDSMSQLFLTFPAFEKPNKRSHLFFLRDYVYENIDKVIYISRKAYESSIVDESKRAFIYNGIPDISDSLRSSFRNDEKINFICVGSINGRKGQEVILQALTFLPEQVLKKIHVYLVGDGNERVNLEKFVVENNIESFVTFMGVRYDVSEILRDMDVFIMPSLNEGLSISSLEALRAGLFLMMTDTGGNCEVMEDNCGITINRNPQELANQVKYVVSNNIISQIQKNRSVDRYHQLFSLEKMAFAYEELMTK